MKKYIKSENTAEVAYKSQFRYPKYIYYQELNSQGRTIYKYKQKYLHAEEPKKDYLEGMYYEVSEIMDGSMEEEFRLISQDERYYMFGTSELDVYPDGFVGYIWGGRLHHLGHLIGDKVVED